MRNHLIGVDQGDLVLFSDFESGGEMWTGRGERERRKRITFAELFRHPPVVQVGLAMWDMDASSVLRGDLVAETVTEDGFDCVFRTWGDSRIARLRVNWLAFGELHQADDWTLD